MKSIILSIALALSLNALGQEQVIRPANPDILIQTTMDKEWSGFLVQKLRTFFINNYNWDFFIYDLKEPIIYDVQPFATKEKGKNKSLEAILNGVGKLFNLNLDKANVKVTVDGLGYKMDKLKFMLHPLTVPGSELYANGDITVGDLQLTTPQIKVQIQLPDQNGTYKDFFVFSADDITVNSKEGEDLEFQSNFKFKENERKNFNLEFVTSDFTKFNSKIESNPDLLNIHVEKYSFPEVKIQVGPRTIVFPPEKINTFLQAQNHKLRDLAIKALGAAFQKGEGQKILKALETVDFDRTYWTDLSLWSMFSFEEFTHNKQGDVITRLKSGYCTPTEYEQFRENCLKHDDRPMNDKDYYKFLRSKALMNNLLHQNNGNIVISASEQYLNQMILKTYEAGFWDDSLKDMPITLGPKKMFAKLDEKGNNASLYLDVIYNPSRIERIAIGEKSIRMLFQLRINMKIDNVKGTPNAVINIADVELSDDFLLYGKPELGVPSNLHKARFKKVVLKEIKTQLRAMIGEDVIKLELPEIKDLNLETFHFFSDGYGRAVGVMKLEKNSLKPVGVKVIEE